MGKFLHYHAMFLVLVISLLSSSLISTPAEATIIIIEPDTFEVGTKVSNVVPGVAINTLNWDSSGVPIWGPVFITDHTTHDIIPTGTHEFGRFGEANIAAFYFDWLNGNSPEYLGFPVSVHSTYPGAMIVQLDRPTSFFEIATSWYSDPPVIFAFNSSNDRVTRYSDVITTIWGRPGANFGTVQLGIEGSNQDPFMQTFIIGGENGWVDLDRIRVDVPEPSTLLLLGLGLIGLAGFVRTKFNK